MISCGPTATGERRAAIAFEMPKAHAPPSASVTATISAVDSLGPPLTFWNIVASPNPSAIKPA